jgi:hypothetical protein
VSAHRLVHHGTGASYWCECACGRWAWLGTYAGDKHRRAKGRDAYQEHLSYEEPRLVP